MKYIECLHDKQVRCHYKGPDGTKQTMDFYPKMLNKYTGLMAHNGFTQVSDETLKALEKESNVFVSFIKQKKLVLRSELPMSVQTPQSIIAAKEKQIQDLTKRINELEKGGGGFTQEDIDAAVAKATLPLQDQIESLAAKCCGLEDCLSAPTTEGEGEKKGKNAKF